MWNCDNYKIWLKNRLVEVKNSLDFKDYDIEVYNEQDYAKHRSIKPKTITVIAKFLSSTLVFSTKTQPIQMLAITEENSVSVANSIITKFCEKWNFAVIPDGATYVKHMYSTPVVLSNFNLIGIGLRTVLYVNTNLFILENVMDINDLFVDDKKIDFISTTIGYTMGGDTQPFGNKFASTVKDFATFVLTVNVACVNTDFTRKCVKIMNGQKDGNDDFKMAFNVGDLPFNFKMKLVGVTLSTAINNVPSLQMSFSV